MISECVSEQNDKKDELENILFAFQKIFYFSVENSKEREILY